jgi:DNA primase
MTLSEIKQISIRKYLHDSGIYPVKDYRYYGMYHCPYRSDRNTSLKVDYNKNVWHDFGTNDGGSIIDLVMKIENCTFKEAVNRLESKGTYKQSTGQPTKQPNIASYEHSNVAISQHSNDHSLSFQDSPPITIQNILPITHSKLTAYINERMINVDLANRYCREVRYRNRDNVYFAVGFRNDKGGYELNSPPDFKGCIPPKEITTFRNEKESCLVFEGFWDFLSYLTIQKIEKTKHDVAVLNSTANVQKAMNFLKSHQEIYTYLDNDEGGQKATELIKSFCQNINNRSERYAGFKDLNDFLRNKPIQKPEVQKKNRGIRR